MTYNLKRDEGKRANEIKQKLTEVAGKYAGFKETTLKESIEFVPINYDLRIF